MFCFLTSLCCLCAEDVGTAVEALPLKAFKSESDATAQSRRTRLPPCSSASHCVCCPSQQPPNKRLPLPLAQIRPVSDHCSQCRCSVWYYFPSTGLTGPQPPVRACNAREISSQVHLSLLHQAAATSSGDADRCPCTCHQLRPDSCNHCRAADCPTARADRQGCRHDGQDRRHDGQDRGGNEHPENQNNINIEGSSPDGEMPPASHK